MSFNNPVMYFVYLLNFGRYMVGHINLLIVLLGKMPKITCGKVEFLTFVRQFITMVSVFYFVKLL